MPRPQLLHIGIIIPGALPPDSLAQTLLPPVFSCKYVLANNFLQTFSRTSCHSYNQQFPSKNLTLSQK
jgi:hypothetical protein